jgi:hypothetical protein
MLHNFTDERLKELWEAEKLKRILILPIALGDKVYEIIRTYNYDYETRDDYEQQTGFKIKAKKVCGFSFLGEDWYVIDNNGDEILLGTEEAIHSLKEAKAIHKKFMTNFKKWVANGRPRC